MPDHAEAVEDALDDVIFDPGGEPGDVAKVTHPIEAFVWFGREPGEPDHSVKVVRKSPRGTWYPVRRQGTLGDIVDWLASYDEPVEIEHGPDRDELPPTQ